MIYHGNRFTLRKGISPEDRDAAFESLRNQGRTIPSVRSYTVGPDIGGEYEYGAVFVLADLAGYEEYMNHPAHLHTDRIGLPLVDVFVSFDITDDPDPEVGAKIAEIHRRRYEALPDIAALVSGLGEYTGSAAPGETDRGAASGTAE
ncbi:Dabb family protein [Streptomyces sp. NPDC004111]|uniref:Dabb family protein n=1 Tax=Streptomyces sp. NPDC004111 TaxID=3364690 RepID=UPI0036C5827E